MEEELLETFGAAKKAADRTQNGGEYTEVKRCVSALRRLKKIPVTRKSLVATQVGKKLRLLTKHSQDEIRTVANDLLQYWKNLVVQEASKNNKKIVPKVEKKIEQAMKLKADRNPKAASTKSDIVSKLKWVEADKAQNDEVTKLGSVKSEKANSDGFSKDENMEPLSKKPPLDTYSLKLNSMVKCNDSVRDKIRELIAEAFSRVPKETAESKSDEVRNILDEVDACDPIRVAVSVESALFEKLGLSTGSQKYKYRSIMFNLRDNNNKDFRRRALLGHVKPQEIATMTTQDMASDDRKAAYKQLKEKLLFKCERRAAPKATTDQFKCGRCGQRKTTYYQMQTRCADEPMLYYLNQPMTTFVTCVNCNNHWKFC
ncbi:transcription elongation factor TFIIS-like [Zingiber officinale]|uniref:transcription elongation factor TFIIS-like n=1 Tax=Zingiber officinale TaxID=94328 RepID=UPI001C4D2D1C|nr:transcription elongation factor TFIIS-like [Zingiber officinale]